MNLLVLDDESSVHDAVRMAAGKEFNLLSALNVQQAIIHLDKFEVDIALVDVRLREGKDAGVNFLQMMKEKHPEKPVLMMSGFKEIPIIVECMKLGADDFIEKPFNRDSLNLRLAKSIGDGRKTRIYKRAFDRANAGHSIIGSSAGILKAKHVIQQAENLRVLIQGETGVGKTPFAWFSNQVVSTRNGLLRPLEQLNCAGLSKERFQDELFGHRKGAFTSALYDKRGLVEAAKGGDLFLDEIGELPLDIQALFLTFLDNLEYYRLGDDQKRRADVRIICATNRNLKQMVTEGKFRKDLYSRISQVSVSVPPLRDRKDDIPQLFEYFVNEFLGKSVPYEFGIIELLQRRNWTDGNVRELKDAVQLICVVGRDADKLSTEHASKFFDVCDDEDTESAIPEMHPTWLEICRKSGLPAAMDTFEKQMLAHHFVHSDSAVEDLAVQLKMSRPTLYRRLRGHGLISESDDRIGGVRGY